VNRKKLALFACTLALAGVPFVSCGPVGFQDEALVNGVRILATRADHPYAPPGSTVTLSVLAADGRTNKPEPMTVYWFPVSLPSPLKLPLPQSAFVCEDPKDDSYYECFANLLPKGDGGVPQGDGAADGGGKGAGGLPSAIGPGVDLSPFLPTGPTFSVPISSDIIAKHAPVSGSYPYGIALVFNMACAGHPELLPVNPNNLSFNQVPLGCFDKNGNLLGSDSYVVGYATIYAYATLTNNNPVISDFLYQDAALDGGYLGDSSTEDASVLGTPLISVPTCGSSDAGSNDCPTYSFDIRVLSSSWEVDPQNLGSNGQPEHEQIWVDYYWTAGSFSDDSRLVYDPVQGYIGKTAVQLTAPSNPTTATFWAVVHDNRGGVSWDVVPYTVE
jgi:hypothetical protein